MYKEEEAVRRMINSYVYSNDEEAARIMIFSYV
jgi:hypothetical protein